MNEKKFSWGASIVYIFAAIALIFTLSVCNKGAGGTPYQGASDGYTGPITVEIIVNEGEITGAKVVSTSDSDFSVPSIDTILEQAVQTGNADNLDVVAGATYTSQGTIAAIQAALAASN